MFNESIENLLRPDTTIHVPLTKQHMINQQCCYYKLIKPSLLFNLLTLNAPDKGYISLVNDEIKRLIYQF
jgi:hypothetical protein